MRDLLNNLPDAAVCVEAAGGLFRDTQEARPDWFNEHIGEYMEYVRGHGERSPFTLPDDIENYICLQENDYLRLSRHPAVREAYLRAGALTGVGKLSAGVFVAQNSESGLLCRDIAESMKTGSAILTTAGWTANVGLMEAIAPEGCPLYLDAKVHASLWDGARLSAGRTIPFGHNSRGHLQKRIGQYGPGVVVLDAYYSTDGSVADLAGCLEVAAEGGCVTVVDESHSFGITGELGGGLAVELGVQDMIHYRTASFSKALGGHGGFIAGPADLIEHLRFRCRSILFSSSTAEIVAAGNRAALGLVMADPAMGRRCLEMGAALRRELRRRGIGTGESACQIVSVTMFGCYSASRLYWRLRENGVLGSVFAYPAMPRSRSLIRFSVHALATEEEMARVAEVTAEGLDELGLRDRVIADAE